MADGDGGDGADWAVRQPHPLLRPFVTRYIGYTQRGTTLAVHRGLPSRHVTLILSLAGPVRVVGMPREGEAPGAFAGLVGGIHLAPALIAQDAYQSGVHLELNPLGARTLLGLPAADLSGYVVDLAALGAPALAALPERLAAAPGWTRRFALLDDALLARLGDAAPAAPEVGWAWRRLLGTGGEMRVGALADEIGWSRRHLLTRFRAELGVSPKQAARVLRFERATRLLRARPGIRLADLAVACGYSDQAHLNHEWRALAGCSPGTWLAEELGQLPFLQDSAADGREDSTA